MHVSLVTTSKCVKFLDISFLPYLPPCSTWGVLSNVRYVRSRDFFFTPNPHAYISFAAWVAWLGLFIINGYTETLNHANYRDWLHFYLPPYTREKKPFGHCWDRTQAIALSITPCLSGTVSGKWRYCSNTEFIMVDQEPWLTFVAPSESSAFSFFFWPMAAINISQPKGSPINRKMIVVDLSISRNNGDVFFCPKKIIAGLEGQPSDPTCLMSVA